MLLMQVDENEFSRCDSHCPRYNINGFCGHGIPVFLQSKYFEKYSYEDVQKKVPHLESWERGICFKQIVC